MAVKKQFNEDVAAVACQIVFEYPNWGSEHVQEMYDCGEDLSGGIDDLEEACMIADRLKKAGTGYFDVQEALEAGNY